MIFKRQHFLWIIRQYNCRAFVVCKLHLSLAASSAAAAAAAATAAAVQCVWRVYDVVYFIALASCKSSLVPCVQLVL